METTSLHSLPQELLPLIFEDFNSCELIEVQKVCRAWYFPLHVLFLKHIHLHSMYEIKRFIASIDHNPDSSYLQAVQRIEIKSAEGHGVDYYFDKESVEKLFCQFPNLTYALINTYSTCLKEISRELCKKILHQCPKLSYFEVLLDSAGDRPHAVYCGTLYKLRSLVTTIKMDNVEFASAFAGVTKFITSFPRLQKIYGFHHYLDSFEEYLRIFERLRHLVAINIRGGFYGDQDNFAERYLASKANEQRKVLIQRLSKVTDVTYYTGDHPFCPNSILFIAKYLTGLKRLTVNCNYAYAHGNWTSLHEQVLLNNITTVVINDLADITLKYIPLSVVVDILPRITQNLFSQLPSKKRTLQIDLRNMDMWQERALLRMQWPTLPKVTITITNEQSAHKIISTLFKSQLDNVDKVSLFFSLKVYYSLELSVDLFNTILQAITSLKEAAFDIPNTMNFIPFEAFFQHTSLETLTLRATERAQIQSFLDTYALMFPKLKDLNLFYHPGISSYVDRYCKLLLNLTDYNLQRLAVDVTSFKQRTPKDDYFYVRVESPEATEQYKISFDFSTITQVNVEDNESYFCFHVIIGSLQSLVCRYSLNRTIQKYSEDPYDEDLKRLIIFNKKLTPL